MKPKTYTYHARRFSQIKAIFELQIQVIFKLDILKGQHKLWKGISTNFT